ncbi:MAG: hypothetical protein EOO38_10540 [Cytophagaceae bacterium]|nr:MAG: hypothetical protein EOO38_10540 [Cytophagaceae bacterium]
MQFTAGQIAALIKGKVEGEAGVTVSSFGKIEEAGEGQLAFLANPKYEDYLYTTKASIIILNETLQLEQPLNATLIRVKDPYSAFATLLDQYQQMKTQALSGVQEPSYIHATAKMGNNVFIGAFVYLGENVVLGDGVKIFPNSYLGPNVVIQMGVTIGNRVVVGANSFVNRDIGEGQKAFGTPARIQPAV